MTDRAHFMIFRVCMGLYLFVHFLGLLPYAGELFSAEGVLRDPGLNAAPGFFGPVAELLASPVAATALVAVQAGLSLAFAAGLWRRGVALALWAGWAYLLARNNGILNPGIPYIGLVLLLCALVPRGEGRALGARRAESWAMPREIMFVAWLALAAGYTFSGYTKLISPNWLNGNAMHLMLDNPLARGQGVIAMLPTWVFALATWGTIALELAALPMAVHARTRKWIWLALTAMHIGVLLTIGFADLTFGMLVTHLFVANPKWLPYPKARQSSHTSENSPPSTKGLHVAT